MIMGCKDEKKKDEKKKDEKKREKENGGAELIEMIVRLFSTRCLPLVRAHD